MHCYMQKNERHYVFSIVENTITWLERHVCVQMLKYIKVIVGDCEVLAWLVNEGTET